MPFRPSHWRIIHGLVFVSGALALVYEILWMRRFAAVFGATTPAVAAVLAAMFLGMSLGSWLIGSRAVRVQGPVRAYGLLEIGVGSGALLVEPLLAFYERIYPGLHNSLAGSTAGFLAVKTLLTAVALFLPSFCMGGTIPLLGHALAGESRRLGLKTTLLYAANTFGAAVGALSVPFLWLPNLSARTTYGVCVVGTFLIGAVAIALNRTETDLPAASEPKAGPVLALPKLALLACFSGATLFILQVMWSRMFAQVHENSIYSFSVVVAVLLVGLAGAAALVKLLLKRGIDPRRIVAIGWVSSGMLVLLTPPVYYFLTDGLSFLGGKWDLRYALRLLWLTIPTVLAPTLLAGMVLPALVELAGASSHKASGTVLGWLLAPNTAGSIFGALLAAFVLPPVLGLWVSLAALGAVIVLCGECVAPVSWRRRLMLVLLVILVVGLSKPASLPRTKFRPDQGEKLLAIREGSHGIVAVVEQGNSRRIKLNNFYVLGGTASTGDERIQAHLPLLLHPAPRRVAFLGLGTGITAGAALLHPPESITAIEIVPEVITAARDYFAEANLSVLNSPRVQVVAEDARNYLSACAGKFDVIVGDLFVPWHQGESLLYTGDHFETARRALAPGGVFCQWLPMFQLSEDEFDIVVATFLDVFPSATLWRGDLSPKQPALALVAHPPINPQSVEWRIRELKPDYANPTLAHPVGLWMFLAGPLDLRMERFRTARRNREVRPWLEILGPLNHAGSARGRAPLFVGRRLEEFLSELRAVSLPTMTDSEKTWQAVGAELSSATLLHSEGKTREAERAMQAAASKLPAELRRFFGPAATN